MQLKQVLDFCHLLQLVCTHNCGYGTYRTALRMKKTVAWDYAWFVDWKKHRNGVKSFCDFVKIAATSSYSPLTCAPSHQNEFVAIKWYRHGLTGHILCAFHACSRTQLEAAARNDWLEALVSLEYEMWGEALKKFIQSEQIYRQVELDIKSVFFNSDCLLVTFSRLVPVTTTWRFRWTKSVREEGIGDQ